MLLIFCLFSGRIVSIRGGRQHEQDLLPEPLPARQAVPRPQDLVLRRGALPLLRAYPGTGNFGYRGDVHHPSTRCE